MELQKMYGNAWFGDVSRRFRGFFGLNFMLFRGLGEVQEQALKAELFHGRPHQGGIRELGVEDPLEIAEMHPFQPFRAGFEALRQSKVARN